MLEFIVGRIACCMPKYLRGRSVKKVWLLSLLLMVLFAQALHAQVFSPGLRPLPTPPPEAEQTPAVSFTFEADDILATEDNFSYYVGKIDGVEGHGKKKVMHIIFADGHEAWVKPERVIEKFHPMGKDDATLNRQVLFTTQQPETFENGSIRFTSFSKGTITSIDELGRKFVTVNGDEVRWDQQVLIW